MVVVPRSEDFLALVERELERQLDTPHRDPLSAASTYLCLGKGGKRARPLLTMVFGEALGLPSQELVKPAVAAELIHASSLLHDDVIDGGMFRRGRPTANARYGNVVAVLSGDVLLSSALHELHIWNPEVAQVALGVVREMSRAAYWEAESRARLDLTLPELRRIAEGKTGSLFGYCGIAAAKVKGDRDAERNFEAFGRRIGVAFQMADDIRDMTGADPRKTKLSDLSSRTINLPTLIAVRKSPALERRIRDAWAWSSLTGPKLEALGEEICSSGAIEESCAIVEQELAAATESLGTYAHTEAGGNLIQWARIFADGITRR